MASIATFQEGNNSGTQIGQNFGTVHINAQGESERCLQLFRLSQGSGGSYEWYKNRIKERVEGTCEWFLKHEHYQHWKEQSSGPLLISADPGCGKSVLAKYLIDSELPGIVCYFFFKEGDQNTIRQALCALLHQLFVQRQLLIKHAIPRFRENGASLVNIPDILWNILQQAANDPEVGPLTIMLDALDECDPESLEDLIRKITRHFQSTAIEQDKIKFLLTCRPYKEVVARFWELGETFRQIRIPGEEHSEEIGREVNRVIEHRVAHLSRKFRLEKELTENLQNRLQSVSHRTYLWVYLIFDLLNKGFKKTSKGIENLITKLPMTVNQAYEKILERSTDHQRALKALSIILVAARPLTLQEMNIAVHIEPSLNAQSIEDLDLEEAQDFKESLRGWCGLLISISHEKIYFLHQTAREFLLGSHLSTPIQSGKWCTSFTLPESHSILAYSSITYLNFAAFQNDPSDLNLSPSEHSLFQYSALHWAEHFRSAGTSLISEIESAASRACQVQATSFPSWLKVLADNDYHGYFSGLSVRSSSLMIVSYLGLTSLVKRFLCPQDINQQDERGRTALYLALEQGYEETAQRILLDPGVDVKHQEGRGITALHLASQRGYEEITQLLLRNPDAGIDTRDMFGNTALICASKRRHEAIVRLLLDQGAKIDTQNQDGQTALYQASKDGHEAIVRLLLDRGADINMRDNHGDTALYAALCAGEIAIFWLLLNQGAEFNTQDGNVQKAFHKASRSGYEAVVRLLLDRGVDPNAQGIFGEIALSSASLCGHETVVRLLLDRGADVNTKLSRGSNTALHLASMTGRESIVRLLLDHGAEVDAKDPDGRTAIYRAMQWCQEATAQLLRERGAVIMPEGSTEEESRRRERLLKGRLR